MHNVQSPNVVSRILVYPRAQPQSSAVHQRNRSLSNRSVRFPFERVLCLPGWYNISLYHSTLGLACCLIRKRICRVISSRAEIFVWLHLYPLLSAAFSLSHFVTQTQDVRSAVFPSLVLSTETDVQKVCLEQVMSHRYVYLGTTGCRGVVIISLLS